MTFDGKRVIITAGAGGIGREITKLFVEAGAKVFVCDIDEQALERTLSSYDNVSGIRVDVSDSDQFQSFFKKADQYLGGLDIMINNAGTAGPTAPIEDISLEEWNACVNINLTSAFIGAIFSKKEFFSLSE